MGKKVQLTDVQKSNIILLKEEGYQQKAIANRLQLSESSVSRIVKSETPFKVGKRSGRPRSTSRHAESKLKRIVQSDPFITSSKAKAEVPELNQVSSRTVRRILHDKLNLPSRKVSKKPLLPKSAVAKRLQFCHKYKHWTENQWSKVLFSDESTFRQFTSIKSFVRRPNKSNPNNKRFSIGTVKHSPQVMVWAAFGYYGRGPLHFIPSGEMMNSTRYRNILEQKLPTWMPLLQCEIFLHDSAPCHKAKLVTQWLNENRIEVLDWPSYSPDLNPIENMWAILKKLVSEKNISSLQHLQQVITDVWCKEITPQLCQKLASSMPSRIDKVIKNKGQATKY